MADECTGAFQRTHFPLPLQLWGRVLRASVPPRGPDPHPKLSYRLPLGRVQAQPRVNVGVLSGRSLLRWLFRFKSGDRNFDSPSSEHDHFIPFMSF